MAEFERGDVVLYNVRNKRDMQQWKHINGAVGIVQKIGYILNENRVPGALVAWIIQISAKTNDILEDGKYPYYLLEKVGHIDLPPEVHGE